MAPRAEHHKESADLSKQYKVQPHSTHSDTPFLISAHLTGAERHRSGLDQFFLPLFGNPGLHQLQRHPINDYSPAKGLLPIRKMAKHPLSLGPDMPREDMRHSLLRGCSQTTELPATGGQVRGHYCCSSTSKDFSLQASL